jgi:alpha-ketoglutarate-dependent taurine dioxygenase
LFGEYGDLPKEAAGQSVYHSTPYPAQKHILFHHEASHTDRWPRQQWFFCVTAAREGGETPIADGRAILASLDPAVRERFERLHLRYVRNFVPGLDVDWRAFFKTDDRAEVERRCAAEGVECAWDADGTLRTSQRCPAVLRHPATGEPVFFNQILLHHVAALEPEVRAAMFDLFTPDQLPRQVYYGDGSPIEDAVVEGVAAQYWAHAVAFPWRAGDLLLVDNMLVAHARNPFAGPRKIVVAMGQMAARSAFTF